MKSIVASCLRGAQVLQSKIANYLESMRNRQAIPVTVALWDGSQIPLGPQSRVRISVRSAQAARFLFRPSLDSLGQGYVEGHLDVDGRIDEVFKVAQTLARQANGDSTRGRLPVGPIARAIGRASHSRKTDRRAIEHHYDVSNAFYALWLDPQLVYSCAYFTDASQDLASAQNAKLEHVCRKLRLAPDQTLLDIGCGWGALAMHAARHHGVRVVGITLSSRQFEMARERVAQAGLSDRVDIRLQDYRDLDGSDTFDRIASVGMFEHVGLNRLGEYFSIVHRLLKPDGVALNHGITSADVQHREVGLGAGSFIDRYVFPDGELPHVSLAIKELSAAGLELVDVESLRRHYALTLSHWSDAFERHLEQLESIAGKQRSRVWRVYLAGCAHAFEQGWINIYQLLAVKSENGSNPLPLTRDFMYRDGGAE
jgi:cyclopropane-fatty-acyl-phospholipid synthase